MSTATEHETRIHTEEDQYHKRDRHQFRCSCGHKGAWRPSVIGAASDANLPPDLPRGAERMSMEAGTNELAERVRQRIESLQLALQSSRSIGTAMGMLVERHRIHPDEAFRRLVERSMQESRKVREIAAEMVAETELY